LIREAFHTTASNRWSEAIIDIAAEGVLDDQGDIDLSSAESSALSSREELKMLEDYMDGPFFRYSIFDNYLINDEP